MLIPLTEVVHLDAEDDEDARESFQRELWINPDYIVRMYPLEKEPEEWENTRIFMRDGGVFEVVETADAIANMVK